MNVLLVLMVGLPFLFAAPVYTLCRRSLKTGYAVMILLMAGLMACASALMISGQEARFSLPLFVSFGLNLKADGFRALYAAIACFMWLMTTLLTPQYLAHGHRQARYCLYTLLTMGATVGVFLSDDLITAFVFFEIMSFTSYCWVAHEENPAAMRAAQTYLAIAVLGGMAMLMGLWLLHLKLGSLQFDHLLLAAQGVPKDSLYLPGALILAGFGAKAGIFPLHVWLPKAHPVAPAPASALLSGILTKVGVFGILVLTTRLFLGDELWGNLLLGLGLVNMVLGALLALFSVDLKRTLACSSMSQIGFILFGVGLQALLGEHNALAAQGTVLHMVNHSLIKLVLFMAAGVVYVHTHQLNLNQIRGYGRRKWDLMLCFAVGAASISGLPFFSGYASKTLLHESLVEYIDHLNALGHSALWYQLAEYAFIIAGGITLCYMIKLFVAVFVEKNPDKQAEYDASGRSMTPLSALAMFGSALVLLYLGIQPEGTLTQLATASLPFLNAHPPEHAVHYLSKVNLMGAAPSIALGIVLYFLVVRTLLMKKNAQGVKEYVNRWPQWLDLENSLYRPLVGSLSSLGYGVAWLFGSVEQLVPAINNLLTFLARSAEVLVEGFTLFLMRTVFKRTKNEKPELVVGNRFTFAMGRLSDRIYLGFHRLIGKTPKEKTSYVYLYAGAWETGKQTVRRMQRTLSYSLILFALGLVVLLAIMLAQN